MVLPTAARRNFHFYLSTLALSSKLATSSCALWIMTETLTWLASSRKVLSPLPPSLIRLHPLPHSVLWPQSLFPFLEHFLLSLAMRPSHRPFHLPGKPFCTSQLALIPQISAPFCFLKIEALTSPPGPASHCLVAPSLFPSEHLAQWWFYFAQNYSILSGGLKAARNSVSLLLTHIASEPNAPGP